MPASPEVKDKPSETTQQPLASARTLLETVMDARRAKGETTTSSGDGESQVTVRETNPMAERGPAGSGNMHSERRVQQPSSSETGEGSTDAMAILGQRLFGTDRWQKKEKKGEEPAGKKDASGETKPEKQAKPAPQPAPQPAPDDKSSPSKQPTVTKVKGMQVTKENLQDIITSAATAAARAVTPKPDAPKKVEDPEVEQMSQRERSRYEVVQQMAHKDQKTYGELPKRFVEFSKSRKQYETDWRKDNPGERFNWSDETHRDWLSNNSPELEYENFADDYDDTRIELRAAQIADEKVGKAKESIEALRTQTIESSLRDIVKEQAKASVTEYAKHIDPDSKWDLTSEEGRRAAMEEDKILGPVAAQWAAELEAVVGEVVRIFDSQGRIKVDVDNNPYHRYLALLSDTVESKLAQGDPDQTRNRSGQTFVTRAVYRQMPPDQRRNHYTIQREELLHLATNDILSKAESDRNAELDKLEAIAKSQGWSFNRDSFVKQKKTQAPPRETAKNTVTAPSMSEDESPPSSTSGRDADPGSSDGSITNEAFSNLMMQRLFPRDKRE